MLGVLQGELPCSREKKKHVCFMQQEYLQLVISKTNSTGDERAMPFTLFLQYTFALIFPTWTSTRFHKKKSTRHFKLNKAKCICITEQLCGIELAVKLTESVRVILYLISIILLCKEVKVIEQFSGRAADGSQVTDN